MSVKVTELRCWNKDDTITFGHRQLRVLRPGNKRADGEIPGLVMTYNEHTGIVQCDAPGFSTPVHVSKAQPILEPAIPAVVAVGPAPAAAPARDTNDLPDHEDDGEEDPTYADEEIPDDDPEVAKLLQGPLAKRAVAKRKKAKA